MRSQHFTAESARAAAFKTSMPANSHASVTPQIPSAGGGASATGRGSWYGRRELSASNTSTIAKILAPRGSASPLSPFKDADLSPVVEKGAGDQVSDLAGGELQRPCQADATVDDAVVVRMRVRAAHGEGAAQGLHQIDVALLSSSEESLTRPRFSAAMMEYRTSPDRARRDRRAPARRKALRQHPVPQVGPRRRPAASERSRERRWAEAA